jgi:hypothetical protein
MSNVAYEGIYGGIVQIQDKSPETKLPMGIGFTIYFYVDFIEKVNVKELQSDAQDDHCLGPGTYSCSWRQDLLREDGNQWRLVRQYD